MARDVRELADPDSDFVTIDGVEVHHKVTGSGRPTMLLFHHFYGNVLTWRWLVPRLAEHGTVVAFDRPGFGFTQRPPRSDWSDRNPYTRRWSADAAAALLDHVHADRAVLIGASAGGTSAIETTLAHPDRVAGLILIGPAISGDVGAPLPLRRPLNASAAVLDLGARLAERFVGAITRERVAGSWHDPSRVTEEHVEAYRRVFEAEGWARGLLEVMTAEPPPDLAAELGRIEAPTMVVSGDSDRTVSPRASRRTAAAIGARFEIIEDCGHTPHEERPDALADLIVDFIRAQDL